MMPSVLVSPYQGASVLKYRGCAYPTVVGQGAGGARLGGVRRGAEAPRRVGLLTFRNDSFADDYRQIEGIA